MHPNRSIDFDGPQAENNLNKPVVSELPSNTTWALLNKIWLLESVVNSIAIWCDAGIQTESHLQEMCQKNIYQIVFFENFGINSWSSLGFPSKQKYLLFA